MKHLICKADAASLAEDDSRFSPVKRLRGGGDDEEEDDMIDEDGALYNEDDDPIFHDDWANPPSSCKHKNTNEISLFVFYVS